MRVYLMGLLLLVLVPPVLLAVYMGADKIADERRDLEQGLRLAAEELAVRVDRIVLSRQQALIVLAESRAAWDPKHRSDLTARAAGFMRHYEAQIILTDPDGELLVDTRTPDAVPMSQPLPASAGSAVARARRSKEPAVGGVFDDPDMGERLIAIAVPVTHEGRVVAVLAALQEVSLFTRLLTVKGLPPGWVVTLQDGNNRVIVSTEPTPPPDDSLRAFTVTSPASGWNVRVGVGPRTAAEPLRRAAAEIGLLLLLVTLGTLLGGAVVARRLGLAVAALADGQEPPRGAARVHEIESAREQLDASRRERAQALAAALAANDALHRTLESMSDGFLAIDRMWRFTVVNQAATRMMGYAAPAALLGRKAHEVLDWAHGKVQFEAARRALASGAQQHIEAFDSRRGRWFDLRMFPSADGLTVYASDITEQRHAAAAVRSAAQRYRMLFEANPVPMWVCDLETMRFLDVNDMALRAYGYGRDEFLSMSIADIRPEDGVQRMREDVQAARDAADAPVFGAGLFRHRTKSGALIDVEITRTVVDFEGRRAGLVAAVDVTSRLAIEREREAADARLRVLLARVNDGFIALDLELRLTFANERALALLGSRSGAELIGRPFEEWCGTWLGEADIARLHDALASGAPQVVDHGSARGEHWFQSRTYPGPEGITVLFTDVTHQRRTLDALRASEERYRRLFDLSPHPKFVRDNETRCVLAVNQAALRAYGYSREEMLALTLDDLVPIEEHELLRADLARHVVDPVASEQSGWQRRHRRKDGHVFDVELVSGPIEFEGRPARLVVATVITERLRVEAERDRALVALRKREERLRLFVAQAPVPLAMFDRDMRYIAASRSWHVNLGLGRTDLTGRHHHEVLPDAKPEWKDVERRGLAGEVVRCEADRFERADGSVQWLRWEVLPWMLPANAEVGGILIYSEDISRRVADERALREAEAYQRGLFEAIGDGVLLLDAGLGVLDANAAALAMLGADRGELLAERLPSYVHGRDAAQVRLILADLCTQASGRSRLTVWEQRRRDGSTYPAEVSARAAEEGRIVVVLRDISERRAAQRALIAHQMELSDLTHRLLTQERETTRHVAQTLHDRLGQDLTVARLRLDAAMARVGASLLPPLRDTCTQVGAAIDRAIADVRLVLGDLRPPMLEEQGLIAALDNEIRARTLDADKVDVLLEVDDGELARRWPGDVEYAAFMIAREAVVNAQQHAGATLVRVIVEGDDRHLKLEVVDDGRGISQEVAGGRPGHLGLVGMRERALAIGAHFAIESTACCGTRIVLRWPAEPVALSGAAGERRSA